MIKCSICNQQFEKSFSLSIHLRKDHKLTPKEYYDKYLKKDSEGLCEVCNQQTKFICLSNGYSKHCSKKCSNSNKKMLKQRKIKIQKLYDNGSIQKKRKETCLKRYGVQNPSQDKTIKNKKKNTFQKHYDVDNCFKSEEIKEKIKQTCLEKFGFEYSGSSAEIHNKKRKTCKEKYGVEHYSMTDEYKEKIKQTCQQKYNINNVFQLEEIKNKIKETCNKKYGVDNYSKCYNFLEKSKETCLKKYSVDNYSKTFEFRLIARNRLIERIKRNHGSINPRIGNNELEFFNEIQKICPYQIILNKYLIGYYPDGRIEELKLIIEFDEPEHFIRGWYKKRDIQKDEDYNLIGYNVYRVKEKDWLNDRSTMIKKIKEIFECISV